jgi:cbb3-type cytochrome oxidase maturation protein
MAATRQLMAMESLYLLVPLSVVIVFVAIRVFFAMSDSGQFDDMVGPSLRLLHDDDRPIVQPKIEEAPQIADRMPSDDC